VNVAINKVHHPVTALGPGRRVGIWLQGCSIRCAGCASLDTWAPDPRLDTTIDALMRWIGALPVDEIDGFTLSGGEPFDQPDALTALLGALAAWRAVHDRAADILAFSGYPLARLERRYPGVLAGLDAVIAEPFRRDRPTKLVWRGSANQRLVPLSPLGRERYGPYVDLEVERPPIQVAVDDSIWYVGVPRAGDLQRLEGMLAAAGVHQEGVSWRA
jgi:anaerobic ribonucleoside-triphosphate reductase activating protein